MMKSSSLFKILFSFILIVLGSLLILANFDIISVEISSFINKNWPLLLTLIGLKWFIDGIRPKVKGGSWTFGSFLAIYSLLVVLGKYDVIDFGFGDIWTLWPLLLIYIGIHSLLFTRGGRRKKEKMFHISFDTDHNKKYRNSTFVEDIHFAEENWTLEPLDLWTGVGNYYFDFTKAYIPEGETPIKLEGWVGDVRMLMPENLAFRIEASANVANIKILNNSADGIRKDYYYETPDYDIATKKVHIVMQFQVGDIRIDQV